MATRGAPQNDSLRIASLLGLRVDRTRDTLRFYNLTIRYGLDTLHLYEKVKVVFEAFLKIVIQKTTNFTYIRGLFLYEAQKLCKHK